MKLLQGMPKPSDVPKKVLFHFRYLCITWLLFTMKLGGIIYVIKGYSFAKLLKGKTNYSWLRKNTT